MFKMKLVLSILLSLGMVNSPFASSTRQFTAEEDALIVQLVESYQHKRWSNIAQDFNRMQPPNKKCGIHVIRYRYMKHLSPEAKLSRRDWLLTEDAIIIEKYNQLGSNWQLIATYLSHRFPRHVQLRYAHLKRTLKGSPLLQSSVINPVSSSTLLAHEMHTTRQPATMPLERAEDHGVSLLGGDVGGNNMPEIFDIETIPSDIHLRHEYSIHDYPYLYGSATDQEKLGHPETEQNDIFGSVFFDFGGNAFGSSF